MNKIFICGLGALFLWGGLAIATAQEEPATTPPPKVLQVIREFVKPGKGGAAHDKAESAFVQAFVRAKWPTHYFAAAALTGRPRVLFFVAYDSFDAWEKDNLATQKNTALSAVLDRASANDGELLSDMDTSVLTYNEEQSLRAPVDIAHMRYFEISLYRVRPGHRAQWNELVKLVKAAYEKVPDTHWAMYEAVFGQEDVTYVVIIPRKSASEIDQSMMNEKQFVEAMGEDGMKKLVELESGAVEFTQSNLFQFRPAMSYPRDEWVKADPEFWKIQAPKPVKAEEKPATKP
ncbi:MAG: hypothetical protein JO356_21275 [Acidobacteria bacterium]|nr:hypothetical protein [Acidobacteriota bacterium]